MSNLPRISDRKYIVPAVERAILILQLLDQAPEGLTISQITQEMSIAKSTVFTILTTLNLYGLVEREEESGRYQLGMGLFTLGSSVIERLDVRSRAYPLLKSLAQQTRLTTHLGILDEGEVVYIEKIEGQGPIKISSAIGRRMGVHCTALGKAILAHVPEEKFLTLFTDYTLLQRTPNTITSVQLLQVDLTKTKERGYSFDDEENELGIRCLGAPIFNHRGEVIHAVSISGPRDRVSLDTIEPLAEKLKQAAQEISQAIGFVPVE
ncbi:MAG: IclR family transcriptional regulator [Anaerolineae bacterium]|nr:IclR family transcriptional regulator [Anaerolineae bacterium]